jgi:hypothetical protein
MSAADPIAEFHADHYLRHNRRRLEHLASLGLPIAGAAVLETGAGIGDHSDFYLDRGCRVLATEGRAENLTLLGQRFANHPRLEARHLDLDDPPRDRLGAFEVIHCYGTLYHLARPERALDFLAGCCAGFMVLETCVSFGDEETLNPVAEPAELPSQAMSGTGCRPTRGWVFARLRERFAHVYVTVTQPAHEEFPLDWTRPPADPSLLSRSVFVASRRVLWNPLLTARLPARQTLEPRAGRSPWSLISRLR